MGIGRLDGEHRDVNNDLSAKLDGDNGFPQQRSFI